MKRLHPVLLVFITASLIAADEAKDELAKKEREKLAGTWKMLSAIRNGEPDAVSKSAVTTYTADGKFSVKLAEGTSGEGEYKLDPSKKPKTIDYTMNYGPTKGKLHEGIYSLRANALKIFLSDPSKP